MCEDSSYQWLSIAWMFWPLVCRSGYKRHKCKKLETWISRLLIKIEVWFIVWRFILSIIIYSTSILSVCLSIRIPKAFMYIIIETWISRLLIKIQTLLLFLCRFIWSVSFYSKDILSVCLSVRLQKTEIYIYNIFIERDILNKFFKKI